MPASSETLIAIRKYTYSLHESLRQGFISEKLFDLLLASSLCSVVQEDVQDRIYFRKFLTCYFSFTERHEIFKKKSCIPSCLSPLACLSSHILNNLLGIQLVTCTTSYKHPTIWKTLSHKVDLDCPRIFTRRFAPAKLKGSIIVRDRVI